MTEDVREVRTDRLVLRAASPADLDDFWTLHHDARVWTHFPSGRHLDRATTRDQLEAYAAGWAEHGLGYWSVRDAASGEFLGMGGCGDRGGVLWNLAYRFRVEAQGHGYATEVARAAVAAAHRVDAGRPVTAYLLEHNDASRRVAERVGLQQVWHGTDVGNPDPAAVRLIFADRPLNPAQLATATELAARVHEPYATTLSAAEVDAITRWHEAAYAADAATDERHLRYLGLDLVVAPDVFAPTPMSDLLGAAVRAEVRDSDRVLDLGTGSGVNAILAASRSRDVTGVDLNPAAVRCAEANAARNGVADRTRFLAGDLWDPVEGRFDLVIIDPPFRWFAARDWREAAMTDEGYGTLGRFVTGLRERLRPGGRALLFFGTSGDEGHLLRLLDGARIHRAIVAERALERDGMVVTYRTWRLT